MALRECYRSSSLHPTMSTEANLGLLSQHLHIHSPWVTYAATAQPGPREKSLPLTQGSILREELEEAAESGVRVPMRQGEQMAGSRGKERCRGGRWRSEEGSLV